jgi:hypothetical protein
VNYMDGFRAMDKFSGTGHKPVSSVIPAAPSAACLAGRGGLGSREAERST